MLSNMMKMATAVVQSVLSSSSSIGGIPARPKCSYGAKCYRKNPQHKLEESHPHEDPMYEQQWLLLHTKDDPAKLVIENNNTTASSSSFSTPAAHERAASDGKAPTHDRRPSKRKADESTASSESVSADSDRPDSVRRVRSKPTAADETVAASSATPSPTSASSSSGAAAAAGAHLLSPKSPTGSDGENVSPRMDKKMSVKERKALAAQSRTNSNESLNLSFEASNISTPTNNHSSSTDSDFPAGAPLLSTAASFSTTPLIASLSSKGAHSSLMLFHEVRAPPSAQVKNGAIVVGRAQGTMKDAEGKEVTIGFVLQSADKMISRLHAKIEWTRSVLPAASRSDPPSFEYHWSISDQNSLNGIFVNNLKISSLPSAKRVLHDRDLITFGGGQGVAEGTLIKQNENSTKGVTLAFRCKAFTGPEAEKKEKELQAHAEEKPPPRSQSPSRPPLLKKTSSTTTVATKRVLAQQLDESTASTTPVSSAKKPRGAARTGSRRAHSPSPPISRSPSRNRSPSPQIRMQIDEATYDQSSTTQNFDSATYGSGVPSSFGSSATQDYHDESRLEDRRVAGLSDTQDFSSSLHPPSSYGTATQDGGNY